MPVRCSKTSITTNASIAARPFVVSARGDIGPNASFFTPFMMGTSVAYIVTRTKTATGTGFPTSCSSIVPRCWSSFTAVARNPTIARRPLMTSGAGPANFIASKKPTVLGSGTGWVTYCGFLGKLSPGTYGGGTPAGGVTSSCIGGPFFTAPLRSVGPVARGTLFVGRMSGSRQPPTQRAGTTPRPLADLSPARGRVVGAMLVIPAFLGRPTTGFPRVRVRRSASQLRLHLDRTRKGYTPQCGNP
mmetsp:Transcript_26851/g.47818  ORF Transcript_26851/g.47818 Transcript_26851/m.47818 type:complete len:245 (+) Transcript_26851:123-857(+)